MKFLKERLNLKGRDMANFQNLVSNLSEIYEFASVRNAGIDPVDISDSVEKLVTLAYGEDAVLKMNQQIVRKKVKNLERDMHELKDHLIAIENEPNPIRSIDGFKKALNEFTDHVREMKKKGTDENADTETELPNPD